MKPHLSRYDVGEKLDQGGMAHVWLGTAKGAGGFTKRVALKTMLPHLALNPEFVKMFEREARLAALLNHPNCIQIFDFGVEDETLYLAMELIDGVSLSRLLDASVRARGAPPAADIVARVVTDALAALDYVHRLADGEGRALELVHRDVSLENLLVSIDGQTKLADFGIAKASTPDLAANTVHGFLKGKLGYMAPEYVLGRKIDSRADLFAMGVVMFRALTGMEFDPSPDALPGPKPSRVRSELPTALDAVVQKALALEPDERFQTAREMAVALEEALTPARRDDVGALVQSLRQLSSSECVETTVLRAQSSAENSMAPLAVDVTRLREAQRREKTVLMSPEPRPTPSLPKPKPPRPAPRFDAVKAAALLLSLLTVCGAGAVFAGLLRDEPPKPTARVTPPAPPPPRKPDPEPEPALPPRADVTERRTELKSSEPAPIVNPISRTRPAARPAPPPRRAAPHREVAETLRDEPPPAPASTQPAKLDVRASPWAEVSIDGRVVGQTPLALQEVAAGPHLIELSNPELGATRKVRVVAAGGEVTTVRERF